MVNVRNTVRAEECRSGGNGGHATFRIVTGGIRFIRSGESSSTGSNTSFDGTSIGSFTRVSTVSSDSLPFWLVFLGVVFGRTVGVRREGREPVREGPHGGIYRFYISHIRTVSCGSITCLHGFVSRHTGVLPHHTANAYTTRRHRLAATVGHTHRVTLLPCIGSWGLGFGRPSKYFFGTRYMVHGSRLVEFFASFEVAMGGVGVSF